MNNSYVTWVEPLFREYYKCKLKRYVVYLLLHIIIFIYLFFALNVRHCITESISQKDICE